MDDAVKQHLVLAREHYEKREYDRAEPHLREVIAKNQSYADVYNMLGVIHHDRGDFQEARKFFEEAVKINPVYTEAALNLAVTYNDLGLYAEAKKFFEESLGRARTPATIEPFARGKIANLHADVAQAYHEVGLLNEAVDEYQRALGLCPQFTDLRVKLGNVFRDKGDFEAAAREYREALKYNWKFAPARVLLGLALFSLGKKQEAKEAWEEALVVDPGNKSAQMYLRMVRASPEGSSAARPSTEVQTAESMAASLAQELAADESPKK